MRMFGVLMLISPHGGIAQISRFLRELLGQCCEALKAGSSSDFRPSRWVKPNRAVSRSYRKIGRHTSVVSPEAHRMGNAHRP